MPDGTPVSGSLPNDGSGRPPSFESPPRRRPPDPAREALSRDASAGRRTMTASDDAAFNAYKILQVDSEADPEVIQAAYRRLAQKWHPDVATGQEAVDRMVAINRAWEILSDPDRRATFDAERARLADRSRHVAEGPAHAPARPSTTDAGRGAGADTGTRRDPAAGAGLHGAARSGTHGAPARAPHPERPPDDVSRDWTTGRSTMGSGYDPASMRTADETGAAGPPPGEPSGSVLMFGRYAGWSLGEIARSNLEYLEWLDRMPIGRMYRDEIDAILRSMGRRRSVQPEASDRRGLFRRR